MEIQNNIFSYATLLKQVKARVALAQKKAIYAANEEMLTMYWDIGKLLSESQKQIGWGNNALEQLSNDLKNDYPKVKGFSPRNCRCMIQFYKEYNQELTIWQQPVAKLEVSNLILPVKQLSWSHNVILMQKVKDLKARYWYMIQCLKNGWGRNFLVEAINQDYYNIHGALANNFDATLPEIQAKQVKETLKDPYIFDMLTFTDEYDERDVELGLIKHIEKFLLQMGAGFAFMGRQYHIEVSEKDFYIDILMYNAFMHRYLVVELKRGEFQPEYIGKLNFYCSAVDDILCREGDNQTIGLLLCQNKDRIMAEYALRDVHKPIGISDYELGRALPKDIKSGLPSIEELENKLSRELQDSEDTI
ncbi:YhcG family protein [Bacteroides ovatus]|uniref:PDDEXK nuclease domain-containing protein n=1 Tax=Bacteroides ovatus TaxID=28116 RepID=UPI002165FA59|nr:PDDEXK nuclease domain-containing protein [Bacteroides ovatus]MCS2298404.1 PDDEXK nuclease domain-containing protein [Bacteroides ovatus]